MKLKLLWLALLLPMIAQAQFTPGVNVNASAVQRNSISGWVRYLQGATEARLALYSDIPTVTPVSFTAFGSTPNANGASVTSNVITLQPYNATNPGGTTTGAQTASGIKSFLNSMNLGSTSTPNGSILYGATSTAGTGTISVTAAGTTVTGTGTTFFSQFVIGDLITANGESRRISAIASNTSMTTAAWTNTFSGAFTLAGGGRFIAQKNGNFSIGDVDVVNSEGAPLDRFTIPLNISRTVIDPSQVLGVRSSMFASRISVDSDQPMYGGGFVGRVKGTNTKNWTSISNGDNVLGVFGTAIVDAGSTGTINQISGGTFATTVDATGATIPYAYGARVMQVQGSGITNAIGFGIPSISAGTNNAHLLIGTTTLPSGNYGIYNNSAYGNFFNGGITTAGGFFDSSVTASTPAFWNGSKRLVTGTTTGTGTTMVLSTSPTLVTPTLGVAAATNLVLAGATSPAWGSPFTKILDFPSGSMVHNGNLDTRLLTNLYYDGSNYKATAAGGSGQIVVSGSGVTLFGGSSVAAGAVPTVTAGLQVTTSGGVNIPSGAGSGTRMVTVNATGDVGFSAVPGGGGGSVTGIAVATANGLAGTSDGAAVVPTLTLRTTVSGILKGNGTAISAATAMTDYLTGASGSYTPTLTNNSNISSSSVPISATYMKVGNIVHVAMTVNIAATASSTNTILYFSLPSGVNAASTSGIGVVTSGSGGPSGVAQYQSATQGKITFQSASTSSTTYYLQFDYSV